MRAAEFYWQGKLDAFEIAVDKMMPGCFDVRDYMNGKALVLTGKSRDGVMYRKSYFENAEFKTIAVHHNLWKTAMEMEVVADEATKRATEGLDRMHDAIKNFRANIKNDLTSMKAASDRVQSEVQQMEKRYKDATALLTSHEFEKAIENAERLAKALESIQKLTETKVSFAVFGQKPH